MRHPYADLIHHVEKPARYLGGEYLSVRKEWDSVDARIVLAFPDLYDVGMSHLGTKILYTLLNRHPRIACERAFAPWPDMEAELRARGLPLLSLESARPLRDFDAVGCSLQYELTYTNLLTLLDLGGIPLRSAARGDDDPIVWAGGPTATHAEPVAPFVDAFFIGEAEDLLPRLLLLDAAGRRAGIGRRERLIALAASGPGVYVPQLYADEVDPASRRIVVGPPLDPRVPARVRRAIVDDLSRHPFPDDAPVPWNEAIFERASIEIARGCTEGCRFCQAGMVYRPARERHPSAIIDAALGALRRGGYDEISLTSLSPADCSSIVPLVQRLATVLRADKASLSVSSLRAYGLSEDMLDAIAAFRATGLTFAPEAGTQRMRDVVNKNVTEDDITGAAERAFARGWSRMKLYFMIGLPTETDDDVRAIGQLGGRLKRLGRRLRRDADVTVSVSSHVPKPHTPFQWCAMDSLAEIGRKQRLLREVAMAERVDFRWHESSITWLEGILSRGDRRLADAVEDAWRAGARFDSWEDRFQAAPWRQAFARHGVDEADYLGPIDLAARLPWDHLDMGIEPSFLVEEYRRALGGRSLFPCGKPAGRLQHHATVEDAEEESHRLVCYHCGLACDLDAMRAERLVFLKALDAHRPPPREQADPPAPVPVEERQPAPEEEAAPVPAASEATPPVDAPTTAEAAPAQRKRPPKPMPQPRFVQGEGVRYRIRYGKLDEVAFLSHLDVARLLERSLRRAGLPVIYSRGFHPKPALTFGPALGLGVAALGELVDGRLDLDLPTDEIRDRLRAASPRGLAIEDVARLGPQDPALGRAIVAGEHASWLPAGALDGVDLAAPRRPVLRSYKGETRSIDVASHVLALRRASDEEGAPLRDRLGWPPGDLLLYRLKVSAEGGARPAEVVESLLGSRPAVAYHARLSLVVDHLQ